MEPVTLKIESGYESKSISLGDEISIGRTDAADVRLEDAGLSRVNSTIFRDGNDVLVVDEGSTNGTFLNGNPVVGPAQVLIDGDRITMGSETVIRVQFSAARESTRPIAKTKQEASVSADPTLQKPLPDVGNKTASKEDSPIVLWVAAASTGLILLLAAIGLLIANWYEESDTAANVPRAVSNELVIPIRVIDPLGKQKQEDLDDLVQYWEVQEKEVTAEDLEVTSVETVAAAEAENFKVDIEFWKSRRAKALEKRDAPTGIWPGNLRSRVPKLLLGPGVPKQKAKIREMQAGGYKIPMDFAELVEKRNAGTLVELPMATEYWVLEVGGSSSTNPFTSFEFGQSYLGVPAPPGTPDYNIIARLANNFSGERYEMNNPGHIRQMKIRLLRMFNPRAKLVLKELAEHYYAKYKRPLRVTSLSRSMQYQMSLNKTNSNSFRVRGPGSLPPHTSGCAFDLGRKHMTADEQVYVMEKLEEMEKRGILDALIEGNANACFHVFVYEDGIPPKGF